MKTKFVLVALLVALTLGLSTTAEAHPRWRRGPRVQIYMGPRPPYYGPRRGYYAPPRAYYAPRPVYYAPRRGHYYAPPRGYYRGRGHHHGYGRRW